MYTAHGAAKLGLDGMNLPMKNILNIVAYLLTFQVFLFR
jgi:hypothetical protein